MTPGAGKMSGKKKLRLSAASFSPHQFNCDHHIAHFPIIITMCLAGNRENCCHKWYADIRFSFHVKVNTQETHPLFVYPAFLATKQRLQVGLNQNIVKVQRMFERGLFYLAQLEL